MAGIETTTASEIRGTEANNPKVAGKPGYPPLNQPVNFKDIDLPSPWSRAEASGIAEAVSIPENLPILGAEMWHECLDSFPIDQCLGNDNNKNVLPSETGIRKEEDRWNFVMNKLINIEQNTGNLTRNVYTLNNKVDSQAELLKEVKSSAVANEQKINDLYKKQEAIMEEVDQRVAAKFKLLEASMQQGNVAFQAQVREDTADQICKVKKEFEDEKLQDRCESRRINLLLVGIKETEGEDLRQVVTSFFSKRMSLPDIQVDTAYRLGKSGGSKPRPTLVRFSGMEYRQKVWFAKSKTKTEKGEERVWIHEDLPKPVKHAHRTLFRILRKAKSLEGRFEDAHIKGQSLYIGGKQYRVDNLESLPEELRPSNLAILQSEQVMVFFGRFTPLSNHHPSPFRIQDRAFTCMEQFLAWSRASLADDQNLISRALSTADPVVHKGILNELHNNKPDEWKEQVEVTATQGLRAKFQQNPALAHFLCSTHPKVLGEASLNKTWGIGLTLTHKEVLKIEKWAPSGNLLGRALMAIREEMVDFKNA